MSIKNVSRQLPLLQLYMHGWLKLVNLLKRSKSPSAYYDSIIGWSDNCGFLIMNSKMCVTKFYALFFLWKYTVHIFTEQPIIQGYFSQVCYFCVWSRLNGAIPFKDFDLRQRLSSVRLTFDAHTHQWLANYVIVCCFVNLIVMCALVICLLATCCSVSMLGASTKNVAWTRVVKSISKWVRFETQIKIKSGNVVNFTPKLERSSIKDGDRSAMI